MSVPEKVRAVVEPIVAAQDLELFDLEQVGGVLRVTIDRPGGVDMAVIASTTRALSRALDEHDPISGHYTLEVSSPGLERPLRTTAHFAWAVGKAVSIKTVPDHPAGRRLAGTVAAAQGNTVTIALADPGVQGDTSVTLELGDIEKARTTFEWGPAPKPGGPKSAGPKSAGPKSGGSKSAGAKPGGAKPSGPKSKAKSKSKSQSTPTEKKVQP
jgi:ribosome maturation factor RimP